MPTTPLPVFENVAGRLLADPAGYLRLVWSSQPRQLADTQALFNALAQALHQRHWGRLLSDQTQMPPLSTAEQQWLGQEWLPGARQLGYRAGAIVVSSNVLSRLATAAITTAQQDAALRYRSFDTEAAALEWLLRQPG